ncbi:MAG: hypothetical protein R2824_11860 [Saprospiraceae bacterium]|nr:hypothetical protein [Lewinella sp.]
MEDISERIQELQTQLETIQRSQRYREELRRKLEAAGQERERLAVVMDKERRDVEQMESWSLKELFVKVTDKEAQLEKEKEEYLQAAIALKEAEKEMEMIRFEVGVLEEKINKQESLQAELEELLRQREEDILRRNPDHPVKPVMQKIARLRQIERELVEALDRGGDVRLNLIEVGRHIHSAKSWSHNVMRNAMYRRRMIVEEVDGARLRLPKLRIEFVKFESELKEVFQFPEFKHWEHDQWGGLQRIQQLVQELSGLTQVFVQGFMRDLMVQKQLHNTLTLIDNLGHQITATLKRLDLERIRISEELSELEKKKQELLR